MTDTSEHAINELKEKCVKPREWLISPALRDSSGRNQTDDLILDANFELFPGWNDDGQQAIRVIEYSAYEALVQKLAKLQQRLKDQAKDDTETLMLVCWIA